MGAKWKQRSSWQHTRGPGGPNKGEADHHESLTSDPITKQAGCKHFYSNHLSFRPTSAWPPPGAPRPSPEVSTAWTPTSPPCSPCPPGTAWTSPSHPYPTWPPRSCGSRSTDTKRALCTPTSTTFSPRSGGSNVTSSHLPWNISTSVDYRRCRCFSGNGVCVHRERSSSPSPSKMKLIKTCLQPCSCSGPSVNMFTEFSSAWPRPGRRRRDSPWGWTASLNVSRCQSPEEVNQSSLSSNYLPISSMIYSSDHTLNNHRYIIFLKKIKASARPILFS